MKYFFPGGKIRSTCNEFGWRTWTQPTERWFPPQGSSAHHRFSTKTGGDENWPIRHFSSEVPEWAPPQNNIITARKSTTLLPFLTFGTFPEFNSPPPRNCAHFAFWPPWSQSFRLVVWWNGPNCGSNLDPSKSLRLQWTTFCVSFSGQSDCFLICQYFLIFDALSIKKPLVGFPITVWIDIRTATRKPWRSSPEFIATLVWLNSLQLNDL